MTQCFTIGAYLDFKMLAALFNLSFVSDELVLLPKRFDLLHCSNFGLGRKRSLNLRGECLKRDFLLDFLDVPLPIELNVFRMTADDQLDLVGLVPVFRFGCEPLDRGTFDLLLKSILYCRWEAGTTNGPFGGEG